MNIRNVSLILNRELKSYFSSLTVYIVIIMFLLMTGYFFYNLLGRCNQYFDNDRSPFSGSEGIG